MPSTTPSPDSSGRPSDAYQILGRKLRALRESCGLTQEAAARHIGASASKVSRLENGRVGQK
ncbi:helix-turn-helix transcriptional regulator [Actinoplanes sp. NPDC024001]|uniref:helix-turn-helix domain-containing protein n=1 Tax=Actinoplanes sp. NPDC024001 TaxID=3154598 RepID=UPI0033CA21D2